MTAACSPSPLPTTRPGLQSFAFPRETCPACACALLRTSPSARLPEVDVIVLYSIGCSCNRP